MRRIFLAILFLTCAITLFAQSDVPIQGIWELQPPEGIFKIYDYNMIAYDLSFESNGTCFLDDDVYGFYVNCNPPVLDSLQTEGTGEYFFEIRDNGVSISDTGILDQRTLNCLSITIDVDGKDTFLHYGRSSLVKFKKIDVLPLELVECLKNENPQVYSVYQRLTKL